MNSEIVKLPNELESNSYIRTIYQIERRGIE